LRHDPERLDRIHPAPVAVEHNSLPSRARHRDAQPH
jgi:hypothetical protein